MSTGQIDCVKGEASEIVASLIVLYDPIQHWEMDKGNVAVAL